MTEESISELENMSIETSKTEKQREKILKKWNIKFKNCGTTTRGVTYM